MKSLFLKKFSLFFLLISLISLSSLPNIGSAEITPEEIIKIQDKIELKERDAQNISNSLIQKIVDEIIYITTSTTSKEFTLEKQVILAIISQTIKKEVANYFLFQVPKEIGKDIIKATIKIACLVLAKDPKVIIDEIEKFTVDKAKEYAMNWLLQNEIRYNNGNFEVSYLDYNKNQQKITFPYIIVYKPLNLYSGQVEIGIYSSESIKTPYPSPRYEWEGGIDELPPFILRIKGEVEKTDTGYRWIEGPEITPVFDEPVPKFEFSKPSILDNLKNELNKTKIALEKASEGINKIGEKVRGIGEAIKRGALSLFRKIKDSFSKLGAQVSSFFGGGEKETLESSLKEKESELERLRQEISRLEEKLDTEEELNSELQLEYESKISNLNVQLDSFNKTIDSLNQQLAGQTTESSKEEIVEETEETSEQEVETEPETTEEIILCQKSEGVSPKRNKIHCQRPDLRK